MTNKELVAQAFAATAQGDGAALVALLADDVTWSLIGTTAWSGRLNGKGEVITKLLLPLGAQLAGPTTVIAERIIAEGDIVVVQARGQNTTRTGQPYNNTYCFVLHLADGLIREVREYADTALIESVLAAPGQ